MFFFVGAKRILLIVFRLEAHAVRAIRAHVNDIMRFQYTVLINPINICRGSIRKLFYYFFCSSRLMQIRYMLYISEFFVGRPVHHSSQMVIGLHEFESTIYPRFGIMFQQKNIYVHCVVGNLNNV